MAEADFLGTGWKFPLVFKEGNLEFSSGSQNIQESILIILQTIRGERVMRPAYGSSLQNEVFSPNDPNTAASLREEVEETLLEFEPRIAVDDVRVTPNGDELNRLDIEIDYTIRAKNQQENLVYPFFLENG